MARVETVIVGGGIASTAPFTTNGIPFVVSGSPPSLSTTDFLSVVPTGTTKGLIVGTDPDATATERLRMNGGMISRPPTTATTSNVMGKGATIGNATSQSLAIGDATAIQASASNNIAIGYTAVITAGSNVTVVGANSSNANSNGTTIVGSSIVVNGGYNAAIVASGLSITIGTGSGGSSGGIVVYGATITIGAGTNINSVVIGNNWTIGVGLQNSTIVGPNDGTNTIGTSCNNNEIVGYKNKVANNMSDCRVLGNQNDIEHNGCTIIGSAVTTTGANQCWIGGPLFSGFIGTVIVGSGDTNGTVHNVLFRLTNGSGTDNVAPSLTFQAGLSTGAGASPAINLSVGIVAGSSTTVQTARVGVSCSYTTTAAATYLSVYDVNGAVLSRVSVGANDSGGAGFKLLRIPN